MLNAESAEDHAEKNNRIFAWFSALSAFNRQVSASVGSHLERARIALRKTAFEALYGPFAWAYDWVSRAFFLGQWRLWQRAAIPFLRGPRVLEVGMGTGDMQIAIRRAGYQVWGVDLSPQMLRQAARKARRLRLPSFWAYRARAQALPFPDAQFDSIISTFPSEYIIDRRTVSELSRVLRPGGRLVVVPGGHLAPRDARSKALEGIARVVYGPQSSMGITSASIERLQKQLENSGWIATLGGRMDESGFRVSTHIVSNPHGAALVVVADKTGL